MPPRAWNHLDPTAPDTPTAASSLIIPTATLCQSTRSRPRRIGGARRPHRRTPRLRDHPPWLTPHPTPPNRVLRRPVESAAARLRSSFSSSRRLFSRRSSVSSAGLAQAQAEPFSGVDLVLPHPVAQARLADPETPGDPGHRPLADTGVLGRALPEFRRMRSRHNGILPSRLEPTRGRSPPNGEGHTRTLSDPARRERASRRKQTHPPWHRRWRRRTAE